METKLAAGAKNELPRGVRAATLARGRQQMPRAKSFRCIASIYKDSLRMGAPLLGVVIKVVDGANKNVVGGGGIRVRGVTLMGLRRFRGNPIIQSSGTGNERLPIGFARPSIRRRETDDSRSHTQAHIGQSSYVRELLFPNPPRPRW